MKHLSLLKLLMIVALSATLFNCAYMSEYGKLERSARDAYSRADYDTAVFMLVRSLQIKQDYEKSQVLLTDAFLMANRGHNNQIKIYEGSSAEFKYDDLVREYKALINLHAAVGNLPPIRHPKTNVMIEFDISDFTSQLSDAQNMAAEAHYKAGDKLAASNAIKDQKAAAKEFKKVLNFVPGYGDAAQRYESSRKAGVKRIAVFPFEDLSGKRKRYGSVEELVVDQMVTAIMRDPSATEFLELISRDQLDRVLAEQKLGLSGMVNEETAMEVGAILGVHEIMTGKITQIIYTPVQTVYRDYKESKKIVVKTEKYKDKEGKTKTRNVYADVDAKVRHNTRSTQAVIKGSYKIVDVRTSKLIRSEAFEGKASFSSEWVSYKGDSRALKRSTKNLAKKGEVLAPVAEEMVSRAATDLANTLSGAIKVYAR